MRSGVLAIFLALSLCWLSLYLGSILKRKKAERLISDLKSFPFATAKFVDARELALRNGGGAIQSSLTYSSPKCTVQDCDFDISIRSLPTNLSLSWKGTVLLDWMLTYAGIRPWAIDTTLAVRGGKLANSVTVIGQVKRGNPGSDAGLMEFEYEVITGMDDPPHFVDARRNYYDVSKPMITGGPADVMIAHISQTLGAPMQRAFDINLQCFTAVLHACSGFGELAPSAWADNLGH